MDDARKPDDPAAAEPVRAESSGPVHAGSGPVNTGSGPVNTAPRSNTPSPLPLDDREAESPERDRGITDFVRRAVSAGVGAASRSKDDIMRVAANEMRTWLEHLDVNNELIKALSKMVIEVKTEIRFRPTEDGKIVPEASNDVKIKGPPRQG